MPAGEIWNFLWVTDFPLFEWSPDENKWNAMHHPFTRPKAEDMPLFETRRPRRVGLMLVKRRGAAPRLGRFAPRLTMSF